MLRLKHWYWFDGSWGWVVCCGKFISIKTSPWCQVHVLSVIMLSDFISGQRPLVLEEAFNQNLMGSFLLANLLTGMVNMCVDALSASSFAALAMKEGGSSTSLPSLSRIKH